MLAQVIRSTFLQTQKKHLVMAVDHPKFRGPLGLTTVFLQVGRSISQRAGSRVHLLRDEMISTTHREGRPPGRRRASHGPPWLHDGVDARFTVRRMVLLGLVGNNERRPPRGPRDGRTPRPLGMSIMRARATPATFRGSGAAGM